MYIKRNAEKILKHFCSLFPAVAVTGPRQSGKSTMLRNIFSKNYQYVSFDDPAQIQLFESDPVGFMDSLILPVILDEVQKLPAIFPYIKIAIDNNRNHYGSFILTGSSQFSFIKQITETLAGRIGFINLLPLDYTELTAAQAEKQMLHGSYPELVARNYSGITEWYSAYVSTYLDRDVRTLYNIGNYRDFRRFLFLLAAYSAQELNMSVISREIGVTVKSIQHWISTLEASYIIFLLPPYFNNLGKRIVKRPKIYFYDTGLVCHLTSIRSAETLERGPLAGPIFENYVIAELKKNHLHTGADCEMFYYRNNAGLEADLIILNNQTQETAYFEIKHSKTIKPEFAGSLKQLIGLEEISNRKKNNISGCVIYRGNSVRQLNQKIQFKPLKAIFSN